MTAPDPGLTDLLAAHAYKPQFMRCSCGDDLWNYPKGGHPAHVALVVEQHTNGRIASGLGADPQDYEIAWAAKLRWQARAEKAEATVARVENAYNAVAIYRVDHELYGDDAYDDLETIDRRSIGAALEGEQR